MKPLRDEIIVKRDANEEKTKAGIILQGNDDDIKLTGTVIDVGPKVKDLKKNDRILFHSQGYIVQMVKGKEVIFMPESTVLAILEK
jgi:co-chaperonin GroES (HSP10)